jgi:hypothetical protein
MRGRHYDPSQTCVYHANPVIGESSCREFFWRRFIAFEIRREEAWGIVDQVIDDCKKRDVVLLQEELVDLERQLNETSGGKTLYTSLQRLLADQKGALGVLLAQVQNY